jgi:hypothetical protein
MVVRFNIARSRLQGYSLDCRAFPAEPFPLRLSVLSVPQQSLRYGARGSGKHLE